MTVTPPHPIKLYNSATRKKELLEPLSPPQVKIYTCGPTVYHYAHIGNFRTYIFEDLLRRTLQFFGYRVVQAMNLTDVDDKTIRGAIREKISLNAFTQPYKTAFFEDLKTLAIQPVEYYPAATDHIPDMIRMIELLLQKKCAYVGGDGSVYFAIHSFSRYGCLSHLKMDTLQAGASERVAADEYEKEQIADFVLWKKYDSERDGPIFWESPFGPGRPGWHIECSAMAMQLLGDTIDIHAGGIDNMFPHHENEIAQSEACSGKLFVKIWMHAEHLLVDHKKMAKSSGNFYTLRDLLEKGYTGPQVRYLLLQTHYKTQLNFTFQALEASKNSLDRLNECIRRIQEISTDKEVDSILPYTTSTLHLFNQALADDLNISAALAAIFDFVRQINSWCDEGKMQRKNGQEALDFLKKIDQVLGVCSFDAAEEPIPPELQQAFEQRLEARKNKNWQLADELRAFISQRGYTIEDTPNGPRLKRS